VAHCAKVIYTPGKESYVADALATEHQ